MLKIFFRIALLFICLTLQAQIESIGSKEYGRIFHFTYHPTAPNTLYAVTAYNHILKSSNNGESWSIFYTYPVKLSQINRLKVLGNDKLTFTVQGGIGDQNHNKIFTLNLANGELIDEVAIPIPTNVTTSYISSFDYYQQDPKYIVVQQYFEIGIGLRAKVYFTTDGGENWDEIYYNVEYDGIFPGTVAISPNNPSKLFICRVGGFNPEDWGGLFVSTDSGNNWVEFMSGIEFDPIAFNPSNPNEILLGSRYDTAQQNLFKSTDGGDTWTPVFTDWSSSFDTGILCIAYNPQNPNKGIFLTVNEVVTTNDGFNTFSINDYENGQYNGDIYYFGNNVAFNPNNPEMVFINANFYPFKSMDGGNLLSRLKTNFSNNQGNVGVIEKNDQSHLYYSIQNGFMHVDRINNVDTPFSVVPVTNYVNFQSTHFFDPNRAGRTYTFVSSFLGSGIVVSNDHGQNIGSLGVPNFFIHAIDSSPANTERVWVSFSDDFIQSKLVQFLVADLENIQQNAINLPSNGLVTAIVHDNFNSNVKLIALDSRVYYTGDNGVTWEQRSSGLQNLISQNGSILSFLKYATNNNKILLGSTEGIYSSTDYGNSWNLILDNFVAHKIFSPDSNPNVIVAISYDTAISELTIKYTEDGGANWNTITSQELEFIYSDAVACEFIPGQATVYINSSDLGLVRYKIGLNTLGTPELDFDSDYALFPNPSKTTFTIKSHTGKSVFKVAIYDMIGKRVGESKSIENIDISHLQSGTYLVQIITDQNESEFHKLIKE